VVFLCQLLEEFLIFFAELASQVHFPIT
jgi:hypothetical protein